MRPLSNFGSILTLALLERAWAFARTLFLRSSPPGGVETSLARSKAGLSRAAFLPLHNGPKTATKKSMPACAPSYRELMIQGSTSTL